MKANRFSFVAATALGGLLTLSSISQAQDTNATHRAQRKAPTVQQRVDRMSAELNLNEEQKTKVTALLEKQGKERRELFADNSLPREERRDKMRALMQHENKELKAILTPEQFEKLKTLREEMRPRRPGGKPGEPGGPAPAPAPAPAPTAEPKSTDSKAQ